MPTTTLTGHPLHAMLTDWPVGHLSFSFFMDVMHRLTGDKSYDDAAYYSMVSGNAGAVVAAAAGIADYLAIPSGSPSKQSGNMHGLLNTALLTLYTRNMMMRRRQRAIGQKRGLMPLLMSAIGISGLTVAAWYGGQMIYDQGMRVQGKSPVEGAPDLKLPGDDRVAEAFSRAGTKITATGPEIKATRREIADRNALESESLPE